MAAHERVEVIPNTVSLEIVRRDFPGALEWLVSDLTSNGFTTAEAQDTIDDLMFWLDGSGALHSEDRLHPCGDSVWDPHAQGVERLLSEPARKVQGERSPGRFEPDIAPR